MPQKIGHAVIRPGLNLGDSPVTILVPEELETVPGIPKREGYIIPDKGYFGPGELPQFDAEFFHIPEGRLEEWVIQRLRARVKNGDGVQDEQLAEETGRQLVRAVRRPADFMEELYFTPGAAEPLPSRSYFDEEPEFKEDL